MAANTTLVQQVFISYSHCDSEFVNQLAAVLLSYDLNVWKDTKDIPIGGNIPKAVYEGIKNASHFCCIISKSSVKSRWVEEELSFAKVRQLGDDALMIVPVIIDAVNIPDYVIAYRCAQMHNRDLTLHNPEMVMLLQAFGVNVKNKITHILIGPSRETMLNRCMILLGEIDHLREQVQLYVGILSEYKQPVPHPPPSAPLISYDASAELKAREERYEREAQEQAYWEREESTRARLEAHEQEEWRKLRDIPPAVLNSMESVRQASKQAGIMLGDSSEFHLWGELSLVLWDVEEICEIIASKEVMGFNEWSLTRIPAWLPKLERKRTSLRNVVGILESWSAFER